MKSFVFHYIWQRITACISLFLIPWFLWSLFTLRRSDYQVIAHYFGDLTNAFLLFLMLMIGFYHGYFGIQSIFLDYVANQKIRFACLSLISGLFVAAFVVACFSLFKLIMAV